VRFPVGHLTKAAVRAEAARLGLATADKPDSQDVCFITATGGRTAFLGDRITTRPGRVVDGAGATVGAVPAVELVTIGQRRGLGLAGGGVPAYVTRVDVASATVTVGSQADLLVDTIVLEEVSWVGDPVRGALLAQTSAHGVPRPCRVEGTTVVFTEPSRRVASGQSIVLYAGDLVIAGGIVA
jgi:tRNA-specific 2-thiouridylase